MKDGYDEANEPRWLRLASTLRAEADPTTLARVCARLASRGAEPGWVRWLSRPVALVASAALLVASAFAGNALLAAGTTTDDDGSLVSALLGDDGSYGLLPGRDVPAGAATSDSQAVTP